MQQVLIADQNLQERSWLEGALSPHYQVISIEEGRKVLEFLRSHTPALMLIEADLPYISGLDICSKMKKIKRLSHVPVMISLPKNHESYKEIIKVIKPDGVFNKPFEASRLLVQIQELIKQKEAELQTRDTLGNTMIIDHALAHLQHNVTIAPVSSEARIKMLETENKYLRKQVEDLDHELDSLRKMIYSQQLKHDEPENDAKQEDANSERLFEFANSLDKKNEIKRRNPWLVNVFGQSS